jgi:transcriptional regulator NrdR family protein
MHKSPSFLRFQFFDQTPNCSEPVFAAEGADVMASSVRYRWTCDPCGHGFTTAERLLNEVPT